MIKNLLIIVLIGIIVLIALGIVDLNVERDTKVTIEWNGEELEEGSDLYDGIKTWYEDIIVEDRI